MSAEDARHQPEVAVQRHAPREVNDEIRDVLPNPEIPC